MNFFRIRLILALIAVVTVVSAASTYFDVLAHKHTFAGELERRTRWMGTSLDRRGRRAGSGRSDGAARAGRELKSATGSLGLAIYDAQGKLLAWQARSSTCSHAEWAGREKRCKRR